MSQTGPVVEEKCWQIGAIVPFACGGVNCLVFPWAGGIIRLLFAAVVH